MTLTEGRRFHQHTKKNLTEGSEARTHILFPCEEKKKNCGVPTFKRRRVTANPKQTTSSDKEAEPASEKRTSPGRAVRGKLVNMVLYCTHDICFPSFIFSLIFFLSFGVSNKNWQLHVLHPIPKKKSNPLSKQGNTNKKK